MTKKNNIMTTLFYLIGIPVLIIAFMRMFHIYIDSIPNNGVGAVCNGGEWNMEKMRREGGQILYYVVGNEEDKLKLTKNGRKTRYHGREVVVAKEIWLLTRMFNIRRYAYSPFDYIQKVGIYPNTRKKPGEVTDGTSIRDRLNLAACTRYVRYLRIDSFVNGHISNAEVKGKDKEIKVGEGADEQIERKGAMVGVHTNFQAMIRVTNLDVIYRVENAEFGSYVHGELETAHNDVLRSKTFEEFQTANFSSRTPDGEKAENLTAEVQERVTGSFGFEVLIFNIVEWEPGPDQERLKKANIEKEVADEEGQAEFIRASYKAKGIVKIGQAEGEARKSRLAPAKECGASGDMVLYTDSMVESAKHIATVPSLQMANLPGLGGGGGGIQAAFFGGNQPPTQPRSPDESQGRGEGRRQKGKRGQDREGSDATKGARVWRPGMPTKTELEQQRLGPPSPPQQPQLPQPPQA